MEEAKDPPPPSAPVVEDKQQVLSTGQRNLPGNDQGSFPSNDQKILPGNNQNLPGNGQTMTVIEVKENQTAHVKILYLHIFSMKKVLIITK